MSRPSHRKSQSTSALAFLASQPSSSSSSSSSPIPPLPTQNRERERSQARYRHRSTMLPSVEESGSASSASASMTVLPGLTTSASTDRQRNTTQTTVSSTTHRAREQRSREKQREHHDRSRSDVHTQDEIDGWLSDIQSLRSSERRRLAALYGLERCLVFACVSGQGDRTSNRLLELFTSQSMYQALIALLTRHAQTLTQRAPSTSIPPRDEVASALIPEIECIITMLQGLCLLSKGCKTAVGEGWVLEMFIDLLLLLRAQPAMGEGTKPIAYNILELLFCVLVDSPKIARAFEKLSGLEAVTRVLKGTGVTKDVRMKCIEFLYFYLLPEQNDTSRTVSSSSTSSSSSTDSHLYPPSLLSDSRSSNESETSFRDRRSPSPNATRPKLSDVDLPFIPMTPRKPPQPALGYLTPSTRKVSICGSASSTPSLATVPASPRVEHSASSRGLAAMLDELEEQPTATPKSSRMNRTQSNDSERSTSTSTGERVGVGLGLGLPKSNSGIVRSSAVQRDLSTQISGETSNLTSPFTDPFNLTANSQRSNSGSSGSSTVVPSPRTLSRSSTQPTLILPQHERASSSLSSRRTSVRRMSKSPLVQSTVPEQGETPEKPKPRRSIPPSEVAAPRTPKIRHSRTQSHLSTLSVPGMPGVPPLPPLPAHPAASPLPSVLGRSPSKQKPRAFPAELTRGLPSSASSPSLATPLGATKRVPSDKRPSISVAVADEKQKDEKKREGAVRLSGKTKEIRSVEEKKEMLGMWLGNVEQLVQGVEKVSLWGSVGGAGRARAKK